MRLSKLVLLVLGMVAIALLGPSHWMDADPRDARAAHVVAARRGVLAVRRDHGGGHARMAVRVSRAPGTLPSSVRSPAGRRGPEPGDRTRLGRRRGGEGLADPARRDLRGERAVGGHRQDHAHDRTGPVPRDRGRARLGHARHRLARARRHALAPGGRGGGGRRLRRRPGGGHRGPGRPDARVVRRAEAG